MRTFDDRTIRWVFAVFVAAMQNGIALFAVYSSGQNRLSDGACIGGGFGTLASLVILGVVILWGIVLAARSFRGTNWHAALKPLGFVALSSAIAIIIGLNAVLSCTV